MKSIGTIENINLIGLKEYIVSKQGENLMKMEEGVFSRMYEEKVFPEQVQVGYEYSSGNYTVAYGNIKHKNFCHSMFRSFFSIYETSNLAAFVVLSDYYMYTQKYNQPLYYAYKSENGYYVETVKEFIFIPNKFITACPFKDYSDIPISRIIGNSDLSKNLPDVGDETQNSLHDKMNRKMAEIESQMQEIKEKEEEQKKEIEKMKLAIEAKYKNVFDIMQQKKQELELMKEQLENQLFVLDTKIYGIRCFYGETVKFVCIAEGKKASVDTPVVLYQKIRFLDEELAKYISLYNFDGDNTSMFEDILRYREDLRDLFFPAGKSVSLVRISRDGFSYKSTSTTAVDGSGVISIYNMMQQYDVYHGGQIAILVRNGEECYIGWTEEDRISISDGNTFLSPQKSISSNIQDVERNFNGDIKEEKTNKNEVASRYFIFSIVQGLIENSKLIELPAGSVVTQSCPYIVFSMAENWLSDDTYGSFDDIMEKCNGTIRKNDRILTLCRISPENQIYNRWSNDRGRGYRNRTHDVYAEDNTIYPVNLVEAAEHEFLIKYEYREKIKDGNTSLQWEKSHYICNATPESYRETFLRGHDIGRYDFRNIQFCGHHMHVFISLCKDNWWSDSDSHANFELNSDEYINLTFLNTVYMKYIIANRKMPKRKVGAATNFSYMLPYLNTAMQYLKERESKELSLIENYTALMENWQVALTDWKLMNDIHVITDYQAKRFARWYNEHRIQEDWRE